MTTLNKKLRIVTDEHGATAIESVALLGVVAFLLIFIWRAFQVDHIDTAGNMQQAGKVQVQQAMDQSLNGQLAEYDQKHHTFSPWTAIFWAISVEGTSGNSNSEDSSNKNSSPNFSGDQDTAQKIERFGQQMQSFTQENWEQMQSQQKKLDNCDDCIRFTPEQLCASDEPIMEAARQIVFSKNPFCQNCEPEVQELAREIKSNTQVTCPLK